MVQPPLKFCQQIDAVAKLAVKHLKMFGSKLAQRPHGNISHLPSEQTGQGED